MSDNNDTVFWRTDFDELSLDKNETLFSRSIPAVCYPKIYKDNRGGFSESLVDKNTVRENKKEFQIDFSKVKQVNRSYSIPGVCRGFHAQRGPYTQGKLVEILGDTPVWDIIVDARPESKSFNSCMMMYLSNKTMNKFWVPRGFLHAFVVVNSVFNGKDDFVKCIEPAQLQYFVDNEYNKESEIVISPDSLLPLIINIEVEHIKKANNKEQLELLPLLKTFGESLIYSEKDTKGISYKDFIDEIQNEYKTTGKSWWK